MKYLFLLILCSLLLVSCDTVWDEPFVPDSDAPDAEGFYTAGGGNYTLKYKREGGTNLHCKLTANGTGWISVGFNPTAQMKDANFIIGYVSGGTGYIRDDFGTDNTAHVSDTSLGGTNDVTLITANETAGATSLEFSIPLNSGDARDRVLTLGSTYGIIFASGSEDNFYGMHSSFATGSIKIR